MTRAEGEAFQAILDADPALRAAWASLQTTLADTAKQMKAGTDPDLDALRTAMLGVMFEAGANAPRH